jgi:hypothetical protein
VDTRDLVDVALQGAPDRPLLLKAQLERRLGREQVVTGLNRTEQLSVTADAAQLDRFA